MRSEPRTASSSVSRPPVGSVRDRSPGLPTCTKMRLAEDDESAGQQIHLVVVERDKPRRDRSADALEPALGAASDLAIAIAPRGSLERLDGGAARAGGGVLVDSAAQRQRGHAPDHRVAILLDSANQREDRARLALPGEVERSRQSDLVSARAAQLVDRLVDVIGRCLARHGQERREHAQ